MEQGPRLWSVGIGFISANPHQTGPDIWITFMGFRIVNIFEYLVPNLHEDLGDAVRLDHNLELR